MGWMSWEIFRCDTDCSKDRNSCISEWLYRNQTDELAQGGYIEAGYVGIHIDDCWMQKQARSGALVPDKDRFPSGMGSLGAYMHSKGAKFGLYTAESPTTCAGYPASAKHEVEDAKLFAQWGVDYMKVDGCGDGSYYQHGYNAMGAALEASGRPIEYSCSWPAYIGDNESVKPFATFIMDGCNLWRNWADIQCNWGSLSSIIDHWGDYGPVLAPYAGPGHWHDMDMLLVGANCLTPAEERTQLGIWSITASPLIMGNDLRSVKPESKALLLNQGMIKVSQDPLGQMGVRLPAFTSQSAQQVWVRRLAGGDVAVVLYNKLGETTAKEPMAAGPKCPSWHEIQGGRIEACGGGAGDFLAGRAPAAGLLTLEQARALCCADAACEGFTFEAPGRKAEYQPASGCRLPRASPGAGAGAVDITINFQDIDLFGPVAVFDIWASKSLGQFTGSFTAVAVPLHDSAFLRLSPAPAAAASLVV